jgi:hypothetical protein
LKLSGCWNSSTVFKFKLATGRVTAESNFEPSPSLTRWSERRHYRDCTLRTPLSRQSWCHNPLTLAVHCKHQSIVHTQQCRCAYESSVCCPSKVDYSPCTINNLNSYELIIDHVNDHDGLTSQSHRSKGPEGVWAMEWRCRQLVRTAPHSISRKRSRECRSGCPHHMATSAPDKVRCRHRCCGHIHDPILRVSLKVTECMCVTARATEA